MVSFGGKSLEDYQQDALTKSIRTMGQPIKQADPLSIPQGEPRYLLSQFSDTTCWIEQKLIEMSALARKRDRLIRKLKDPALQESPQIGSARLRRRQMDSELMQYASDITELEAQADRLWQGMEPSVRGQYSMDWNTPEWTERLIGQAWLHIAARQKWPGNYALDVGAVNVHPYLKRELVAALGPDPHVLGEWSDPFEEKE